MLLSLSPFVQYILEQFAHDHLSICALELSILCMVIKLDVTSQFGFFVSKDTHGPAKLPIHCLARFFIYQLSPRSLVPNGFSGQFFF